MKIALLILASLIIVTVVAYLLLFPRNTFISISIPEMSGRRVTFSRTGVSFEAAPTHYAANGFDHIEPYVARLIEPTKGFKSLSIFTPDGTRGFGFSAKDGVVEAGLMVDWRQDAKREADIRAFFTSLGIEPSRDYLAGNGGVPDATRILDYPITGSTAEVTALTKRILQELCGVSPSEALNISYEEQ